MKRLLFSIACLLCVCPAVALAHVNITLFNNTTVVANSLVVVFERVVTVTEHFDGYPGMQFPQFTTSVVTIDGIDRTVATWSGLVVQVGSLVHIGWVLNKDCGEEVKVHGFYWAFDGVFVGQAWSVNTYTFSWVPDGATIRLRNNIYYCGVADPPCPPPPFDYCIGPVYAYYLRNPLPLALLNETAIPTWNPERVDLVVPENPPYCLAWNAWWDVNDLSAPEGYWYIVWVIAVGKIEITHTSWTLVFVQTEPCGTVRTENDTWGGVKTLYR